MPGSLWTFDAALRAKDDRFGAGAVESITGRTRYDATPRLVPEATAG